MSTVPSSPEPVHQVSITAHPSRWPDLLSKILALFQVGEKVAIQFTPPDVTAVLETAAGVTAEVAPIVIAIVDASAEPVA